MSSASHQSERNEDLRSASGRDDSHTLYYARRGLLNLLAVFWKSLQLARRGNEGKGEAIVAFAADGLDGSGSDSRFGG